MEKTLKVINEMQSAGVIGRYAIGGAIAAIFYIEPFATRDIDGFIMLPQTRALISLEPIYQYLKSRGYQTIGDAVDTEGWPVQFLPAFNSLLEEALEAANDIDYGKTPTRIFTAEHLIAVMVQTRRPKDIARVRAFQEQCSAIDQERLEMILARHNLLDKWYSIIRTKDF